MFYSQSPSPDTSSLSSSSSQEDIIEIKEKPKSSSSPETPLEQPKSACNDEKSGELSTSPATSKLRDALLCQICCDQQLSMVFLPCGHSMSCPSCATALTTCPLCRKRIEATVRAYFPFAS